MAKKIIVVSGEPISAGNAEKVASPKASPKRVLGSLRDSLKVPEDFDDPLPEELLLAFEGEQAAEIRRRLADIDTGAVELADGEDALRAARVRIKERRR